MGFMGRLGYLFYVLSWICALPLLAIMVWSGFTPTLGTADQWTFGILGIGFLVVGRGVYFLLAGR